MTVFALWHGGSSYAPGSIETDLEAFDDVQSAAWALMYREHVGATVLQDFRYVHRAPERCYTPVTTDSEMLLYYSDPTDSPDPYPDAIATIGEDERVHVSSC